VRTDDLDYRLPQELIAQRAAEPRDSARLLVLDRRTGAVRHRVFRDLAGELHEGDLLVVNDTRVLPVRIRARRATGGAAEVLLLEPREGGAWEALVRPYRRLRDGERLDARGLAVVVLERLGDGRAVVRPEAAGSLEEALAVAGEMPLPPYITERPADPGRYQTVYARHPGSAAAPTAGLHFTAEILDQCRVRAEIAYVTLHVGLGTFQPLHAERVEDGRLHSERYCISEENAAKLRAAERVVCVGTTSVRTVESAWQDGRMAGETEIFIYPGYRFRRAGAMLTNFHLPRTSLLLLVSAFGGKDLVLAAYRHAVESNYRFYSYGDCMLLL